MRVYRGLVFVFAAVVMSFSMVDSSMAAADCEYFGNCNGQDGPPENAGGGDSIKNLQSASGFLTSSAATTTEHPVVELFSSGTFISAFYAIQGSNGTSCVRFRIDEREIISRCLNPLKNWGFTTPNQFGLKVTEAGGQWLVTIGFPTPIKFETSLELAFYVHSNDSSIAQVYAKVLYGD